jgi:hypothetical protein
VWLRLLNLPLKCSDIKAKVARVAGNFADNVTSAMAEVGVTCSSCTYLGLDLRVGLFASLMCATSSRWMLMMTCSAGNFADSVTSAMAEVGVATCRFMCAYGCALMPRTVCIVDVCNQQLVDVDDVWGWKLC